MAKTNYQFEKRRKELAKKKKKDAKRQRKLDKASIQPDENPHRSSGENKE